MAKGAIPYSLDTFRECDAEPWGHIDLLEQHYGEHRQEEIKKTYHWTELEAGRGMSGNRGSVNWAVCHEWHQQHPSDLGTSSTARGDEK